MSWSIVHFASKYQNLKFETSVPEILLVSCALSLQKKRESFYGLIKSGDEKKTVLSCCLFSRSDK